MESGQRPTLAEVLDRAVAHNGSARLPVKRYADAAERRDPYRYCEHLPPAQVRMAERLAHRCPADFEALQRDTLVELIRRRLRDPGFSALPDTIRQRSLEWFERILDEAQSVSPGRFDWRQLDAIGRSDLLKDFAVAAGRALPLRGAWIAERRRLMPRELFAERGPAGAGGASSRPIARRVAARLAAPVRELRRAWRTRRGCYDDYLVIHTAYRYRRQFSPRFMARAYADLAALLRADPEIVGVHRKSWFLDPALADVEPRLAFLRTVPEEHGAEVHRLGPVDPEERPEILAFSAARREAFEHGAYRPAEWAFLWRREDVLRWADAAADSVAG